LVGHSFRQADVKRVEEEREEEQELRHGQSVTDKGPSLNPKRNKTVRLGPTVYYLVIAKQVYLLTNDPTGRRKVSTIIK